MVNPLHALLVALLISAALWLLWRPRSGLFWQWRRSLRSNRRVLLEDALKHLYHCEYQQLPATLTSLSGALSVSRDKAAKTLAQLESLGLVKSRALEVVLTEEGREYALRIIRVHRLWEKYLADKTGFSELDWHEEAERQEHRLTPGEANALAEQLGNPGFDPHGDPIPTASGELPPPRGIPLTELSQGRFAEILHIEDEPPLLYAQLVAQGLHPGMNIQLLDISPKRIHLAAAGGHIYLAPVAAANLTVRPFDNGRVIEEESSYRSLSQQVPGETAVVKGISKACRGIQRRRLMDLGILPGTEISVEMRSAGGDPTAYCIRGAVIALRKSQTDLILVEAARSAAAAEKKGKDHLNQNSHRISENNNP